MSGSGRPTQKRTGRNFPRRYYPDRVQRVSLSLVSARHTPHLIARSTPVSSLVIRPQKAKARQTATAPRHWTLPRFVPLSCRFAPRLDGYGRIVRPFGRRCTLRPSLRPAPHLILSSTGIIKAAVWHNVPTMRRACQRAAGPARIGCHVGGHIGCHVVATVRSGLKPRVKSHLRGPRNNAPRTCAHPATRAGIRSRNP